MFVVHKAYVALAHVAPAPAHAAYSTSIMSSMIAGVQVLLLLQLRCSSIGAVH